MTQVNIILDFPIVGASLYEVTNTDLKPTINRHVPETMTAKERITELSVQGCRDRYAWGKPCEPSPLRGVS